MTDSHDHQPPAVFDRPLDDALDWPLAARYLADQCTPAERAAFERWVAARPSRQAELHELRALWAGAEDRVADEVTSAEAEEAWRAARRRLDVRLPRMRRLESVPMIRVAAACLVAAAVIAMGSLGWRHWDVARRGRLETITYATGRGEQRALHLPDGTRVLLASDSRLRVFPRALGRDRVVELDGEGYFTVVHNAWHPFAVRTGHVTITDVGTVFDVRHYADDPAVRVAVAQGQVRVAVAGGASERPLGVGDMALVTNTATAVTRDVDVAAIAAWSQGRLVFRDTPLSQVVRDLSRMYDLDIAVADSTLMTAPITASFDVESDDQVLQVVTRIIGARYDRIGRKVIIRGGTPAAKSIPDSRAPALQTTQALSPHPS